MDIKEIANQSFISGEILIGGQLIVPHEVVQKDHFKIIYFDELLLSLQKTPK